MFPQARPELFRAMIREFFVQAKRNPWKGGRWMFFRWIRGEKYILRNESVARLFGVYIAGGDLNVAADTFLEVSISEAALSVERPNHEQHCHGGAFS